MCASPVGVCYAHRIMCGYQQKSTDYKHQTDPVIIGTEQEE